jgi:hypothetical protein
MVTKEDESKKSINHIWFDKEQDTIRRTTYLKMGQTAIWGVLELWLVFLALCQSIMITMFINNRGRGGWIIYNGYLIRLGPLNGLQFSLFPHYNTLYYNSTLHFCTL